MSSKVQPQLALVGVDVARWDGVQKVTGHPIYTMDTYPRNALHLKVLRSEVPHALIKRLDVSKATARQGVAAILTAKDVPGSNMSSYLVQDRPVFAEDRVRCVGDPIAVVAAEDVETAEEALDLIQVDYEPLPAVFSAKEAMKPDAPKIHESGNLCKHLKLRKGDVEVGFKQADVIIENNFRTPTQEPAPIEPEAGYAILEPDGSVTCVACLQNLYEVHQGLIRILGLPKEKVRVVQAATGGAFGPKSDESPIDVLSMTSIVALRTGRPAVLEYSREESVICHTKRHPFDIHLKSGATKEGKLTAWEAELVCDTGAYASLGPLVILRALFHATGPYEIPHVKSDAYCVYTNNTFCGSFRGFGNPQAHFAAESQMDELAWTLKMDPLELRLKNILRPDALTATSQRLDESCGLEECAARVAKEIDWYNKRKQYSMMTGEKRRGVGIALMYHGNSLGPETADFATVHMSIRKDGKATFRTGMTEYGTGASTGLLQIAAETLGFRYSDIIIEEPDTKFCDDSGPTVASRMTVIGGKATQMAAARLREKLEMVAASMLGCRDGCVAVKDSRAFCTKSVKSSIDIGSLAEESYRRNIDLKESLTYTAPPCVFDEATSQGTTYLQYTFGAMAAEVEVDVKDGTPKVLKLVAAYDVGKAISPLGVIGQMEGGAVQSLGYGIMEELVHDGGVVKNPNLCDYEIPTSLDIPEIIPIVVEYPGPIGPYGAKAMGEPPVVLPAVAIGNAIAHAIGRRIYEAPATSERILRAMGRVGQR